MHSSRMRTARSSSCHRGVLHTPPGASTPHPWEQAPQGAGNPQSRHPPEQASPRSRHLLTRSPSTSPLSVGLDQIPLNFPIGCGPGPDPPQLPPWVWAFKPARHAGIPHPPGDWLQGMLGYHLQCMLG